MAVRKRLFVRLGMSDIDLFRFLVQIPVYYCNVNVNTQGLEGTLINAHRQTERQIDRHRHTKTDIEIHAHARTHIHNI